MSQATARLWAAKIGQLAELRMRLDTVSPLYPLTVPKLAATPADVAATEQRLGRPLDAQHAELLTFINGWDSMFGDISLLSLDHLGRSDLWRTGDMLLGYLYGEPPPGLPPREELDIIAVSQSQEDVFAVWRGGQLTDGGHPVIWFASELVETQDNVYEWLGAIIQYTERRLDRLRAAAERP
ncbi:SMI1/KNR4 family protein [Actinotalea sp. JY-7876]|uniref:SMI1/KNR4 family protein n=1 Tax=Actinotalea sp. JY-7876 TaxID=2758442 RepID=UPI0015F56EE7|nr:SMI1/KNR4 family protein [Actinotalea sp. JY-7876]